MGLALMRAVAQQMVANDCARFQWQAIDWNKAAIDFYVHRMGARERVEEGGARWLNYIMDRAAAQRFLAGEKITSSVP